jgi:phosphoglycolate phosphatase-like HAD superfamily hydrolase
MKIKFLITDMDGVVFDRIPLYRSVFEDCLEQYVPREISGRHYFDTLGLPLDLMMKGALGLRGIVISDDEIGEIVKKYWESVGRHEVKLFPGIEETWKELSDRGIIFFASSGSNTEELGRLIKKFGLPYSVFLGSDDLPKGDKHIEIFSNSCGLGADDFCRQAGFLGDGTVDMEIASRNKIFGIGITNTIPKEKLLAAGATAVIKSVYELPDLLK